VDSESVTEIVKNINLQSIFTGIITTFFSISSKSGLILFFLVFILLESRFLSKKLYLILRNSPKDAVILEILEKIKSDIKTYFMVKTIVSVITGVLCYLVMSIF
jgi:predicted PurR-regulated permease PerM